MQNHIKKKKKIYIYIYIYVYIYYVYRERDNRLVNESAFVFKNVTWLFKTML